MAYFGVWNFGFVYDDGMLLTDNSLIKSFRPVSKFLLEPAVFNGDVDDPQNWRPMAGLAKAISWAAFGMNPAGYHIVNLILHLLNVVLIFFLAKNLLKTDRLAWLVAILYSIHPVLTESVTWIAAQNNLLWATFFLAACLLTQSKKFWWAIGFFALALLTKETALAGLPILLLLMHWKKDSATKVSNPTLGYAVLIIVYLIGRFSILGNAPGEDWGSALIIPAVFWKYISLAFWPADLIVNYNPFSNFPSPQNLLDGRVIGGLFSGVATVWLLKYFWKRSWRVEFLGLAWFVVFLLPVLQILPFVDLIGERALYVPLIGLTLLVVSLVNRFNPKLFWLAVIIAPLFIYLTIARNQDWRNERTIWEAALRVDPANARAYANLTYYYLNTDINPEKALELADKFLKIRPGYRTVWINWATANSMLGNYQVAEAELLKILTQYPGDAAVINNLDRNRQRWRAALASD
ncbi:MAG: TPR domain-containing protein [Parcubacteria group bacterium Gr01-1014_19]|nr:MAG: TPR domain-containing protein [Parcubacteria group bacterium Gr01-1014_19]